LPLFFLPLINRMIGLGEKLVVEYADQTAKNYNRNQTGTDGNHYQSGTKFFR